MFLLHVHQEITDSVDLCNIAREFVSVNQRRMESFELAMYLNLCFNMTLREASIIIGSIQAADYNSGPPTTFHLPTPL